MTPWLKTAKELFTGEDEGASIRRIRLTAPPGFSSYPGRDYLAWNDIEQSFYVSGELNLCGAWTKP